VNSLMQEAAIRLLDAATVSNPPHRDAASLKTTPVDEVGWEFHVAPRDHGDALTWFKPQRWLDVHVALENGLCGLGQGLGGCGRETVACARIDDVDRGVGRLTLVVSDPCRHACDEER
jgi:hypothetical protein